MITESLGYSIFAGEERAEDVWYCTSKLTEAKAQYRGDKFVVLAGSVIDKSYTPSLEEHFPKDIKEREELMSKHGNDNGNVVEITENIPFKSPNHAGKFVTGRNLNAWKTWKNSEGKTMDELMARSTCHAEEVLEYIPEVDFCCMTKKELDEYPDVELFVTHLLFPWLTHQTGGRATIQIYWHDRGGFWVEHRHSFIHDGMSSQH